MRRLAALLLIVCFNGFLLGPLLVSGNGASPSKLPACCRKAGRHHCMASASPAPDNVPTASAIPEKCALFPQYAAISQARSFVSAEQRSVDSTLYATPASIVDVEALRRHSLSHPRHQRGPPASA